MSRDQDRKDLAALVHAALTVRMVRAGVGIGGGDTALGGAVLVRAVRRVHGVHGVHGDREMISRGVLRPCGSSGVAFGARRVREDLVWDADSPLEAGQARECLSAAT
jgi:hypothetical protein